MILVVERKLPLSPFHLSYENAQVIWISIDFFRYDLEGQALEILIHGAPDKLITDQRPTFKNELVGAFIKLDGC